MNPSENVESGSLGDLMQNKKCSRFMEGESFDFNPETGRIIIF